MAKVKKEKYWFLKYIVVVYLLIVIGSIFLIPGYRERFPVVLSSKRGLYYICILVGLIQLYILQGAKRVKVLTPLCVVVLIVSFVCFWTCK